MRLTAVAVAVGILCPGLTSTVAAQDLPSLDQLFVPTPTPTPSAEPTPTISPTPSTIEAIPGLEPIVPGGPLTTPLPSNADLGRPPELGTVVERQQRRRDVDAILAQIREEFAQGRFAQVLELVAKAEAIEKDNPNVKFYKDWATKKIRTGEGPRGAVINNPRLGGAQSTPDPSIPTPRTMRTPRLDTPVPTVAPQIIPSPVASDPGAGTPPENVPTPAPQSTPSLPAPVVVPPVASSGGIIGEYGPIALAVAIALGVLGLAVFLLSKRTPLPTAPKIPHHPVPILPNLLAQAPVEPYPGMAGSQRGHALDPQTLVIEDDEPVMGSAPPPMADFPGAPPGAFSQVGFGLAPAPEPSPVPPGGFSSPAVDVLPTVDEQNHDDTMYAIEEDPYVPLPDPMDALEATAYEFHEAKTLEIGLGEDVESTQISPGPLPPSSFGLDPLEDVDRTIPLLGPLPPSKFESKAAPSPASNASPAPAPPAPAPVSPVPAQPVIEDPMAAFSFDPDVTVPVAAKLPPSRFDLPAPPAPAIADDDVIATPLLDLPMGDDGPTGPVPALPKSLLGVFPGKAKAAAENPVPPAPVVPEPPPAAPLLPPAPAGQEGVIDLGSLGISFASTPTPKPAPAPPPEPKEAPSPLSAFAGFDKITLADSPTPYGESVSQKDAQLGATADMSSPYQVDAALSATKTLDGSVGSDSIYGNPALSEADASADMFRKELERGDKAAAAGDWKKAVHYYAIAASIQSDNAELMEKLHIAREKKKELEGH